jgi:hypothetical protein
MTNTLEAQTRRALLAGAVVAAGGLAVAGNASAAPVSPSPGHEHDWDWMIGRWTVTHRKLKARLAGSDAWAEFDGTTEFWPTLGGLGNIDDNLLHDPSGAYRAVTLRAFDPVAGHWLIWWQDARSPSDLGAPVAGVFRDGVGTFMGDDTLAGKPIKVSFIWSGTRTASPMWEQAFSADGGKTWETNWQMRFSRASA